MARDFFSDILNKPTSTIKNVGKSIGDIAGNKYVQSSIKHIVNPVTSYAKDATNLLYNILLPNKTVSDKAFGDSSSGGFRGETATPEQIKMAENNIYNSVENYIPESSSYSSSISAGVGEPNKIDLTSLFQTYTDAANAQKNTISGNYANQRQQLLDSLKRYQDETALARQQQTDLANRSIAQQTEDTAAARLLQQKAFNANRADLEAQAYLANRNALQSAASRGLGGSGLQQLAQLQSQLASGKETSNLANSNQEAQNELTKQLKNYTTNVNENLSDYLEKLDTQLKGQNESITSQVNSLSQEEANKLNEIEKNTANLKAQMDYQEAVRFEQALQEAQRFNASMAASSAATNANNQANYNDYINDVNSVLENAKNAIQNAANATYTGKDKEGQKKKAIEDAYNNYLTYLNTARSNSGISPSNATSIYTNAQQQIENEYRKQLNNLMNSGKNVKSNNNNILNTFLDIITG